MNKLNSFWGRISAHIQTLFVDHEILRKLYRNFYRIDSQAYRSNHPSARFIRKLKNKYGIKTIVSLRKPDKSGQYLLEKEACDKYGIKLINHPMSSCKMPKPERILEANELFDTIQYPILIHCKSGADRAGLMSVLYRHFVLNEPIAIARKELSIKYGHFRWADTGKLDYFFDCYERFFESNPDISFTQWVEGHYDRDKLDAEFHSAGWANLIVHKILHRE
ncbi:MAG: tyrosine-protein phosphatase [Methyloprofundus sp.]|nr:tyrosine-protein phosphatase [Methyloprofundus sp.]